MSAGISSANAPELDLPARFMVCGMACLGILALAAPWTMPLLLKGFATPQLLALVHANTVGVIGAVIIGASYQLVPVVIETPLVQPQLGRLSFWVYLLGLLCFVTGLATGWLVVLAAGGTFLGIAFALYISVVALTLRRAARLDVVAWHIVVALGNLSLAVCLGVLLAYNKLTGFLGDLTLALLGSHATFMLAGWVVVLLAGVAYRLVGMFTLAEDALSHPVAWAGLACSGLAPWLLSSYWLKLGPRLVGIVGAIMLCGGLLLFAGQLLWLYRHRRRRNIDVHIPFALTAAGCGVVSASLFVVSMVRGLGPNEIVWNIVVWLAIAGLAETAIQGFFYKIATFLTWLHRYAPVAGRQPVPRLEELYQPRLAIAGWLLWTIGVLLMVPAIVTSSPILSQIAGVIQALGLGCFLWNTATIGSHWRVPNKARFENPGAESTAPHRR